MKSLPATAPVSVVIPMYNAAAYIGDAIRSVLAQTVRPREIVVVDDGSTDASAAVATGFPGIRSISQLHAGSGAALNRGIAAAGEEFLAFVDADDLWTADKLARQMHVMTAPVPPDILLGHARNFHSPELSAELRQAIECRPAPLEGYSFGTMLIRRAAFHRVGPLAPNLTIGHFIEWFARAQDLGLTSLMLPDVLLLRRLHADNLSRRERAARPDFARILKSALDRRRALQPGRDPLQPR